MTMPTPPPTPGDAAAEMTFDERSTLSEAERTAYDGALAMLQDRRNAMIDPAFIRDTLRSLAKARDALSAIAEHTDPEPPDENYRMDDREGCLDTVFSLARKALGGPR